jgi:hypothetical protein
VEVGERATPERGSVARLVVEANGVRHGKHWRSLRRGSSWGSGKRLQPWKRELQPLPPDGIQRTLGHCARTRPSRASPASTRRR